MLPHKIDGADFCVKNNTSWRGGGVNKSGCFFSCTICRHLSFSRLFSLIYGAACETPVLHVSSNLLSKSTRAYISHTIECFMNVKPFIQDDKFRRHTFDIFCIHHHTTVSKDRALCGFELKAFFGTKSMLRLGNCFHISYDRSLVRFCLSAHMKIVRADEKYVSEE